MAEILFLSRILQIPKQLFKKPHPQKKGRWLKGAEPGAAADDRVFYRNLDNLKQSSAPVKGQLRGYLFVMSFVTQPTFSVCLVWQRSAAVWA